jgi:choline dehydrogenase-like flavoprotein
MIADPIQAGLARGWRVVDAVALNGDLDLTADVLVVGSGAGGGVTAEILSAAGLRVILVEEGPLASSGEFRMREREAYPRLYQDSAGRQTLDKSITLFQGRCVGGGTTVNWTSSFRTPRRTLDHWRERHGLKEMSEAALEPWFQRMEQRLAIAPWPVAPNENNDILRRGCEKLGIASAAMQRNVKGCHNLGYCGTGCPTNAKQSMLVTTIPAALDKGATLVHRARVQQLVAKGDRVLGAIAHPVERNGAAPSSPTIKLRAAHVVLCSGAIGTPGILLRSGAPDPHQVLGRRTFLHPTIVSGAVMPDRVEGFNGAPQSIYSDHFLDAAALDGPAGYKLESAPTHPVLVGITLPGFGESHSRWMAQLPHVQVVIALIRDGFHAQSRGGRVLLRGDGTPILDYAMNDYLWEAARRAFLTMAEIQFAAGAKAVMPMHEGARTFDSWRAARQGIAAMPLGPLATRVVTAHVMGGCAMGSDPRASVVDEAGMHHQWRGLSVHDASIFPTSVGANPQLSIYATSARLAAGLARSLGRPLPA